MRQIPTFVSIVAIACASALTLRIAGRELSWTVPVYVIAQFFFGLVGWWGLQRGDKHQTAYLWAFVGMFSLVIFCAFLATGRLVAVAFDFGGAMLDAVGAAVISGVVFALVAKRLAVDDQIAFWKVIILAQAGLFLFCGVATFLTLIAGLRPAPQSVALALGGFWSLVGAFMFAHAIGIERTFGPRWSRLNDFAPQMLAIIAFSWLAFQLSSCQHEGSRQVVPSFVAAPLTAEEE